MEVREGVKNDEICQGQPWSNYKPASYNGPISDLPCFHRKRGRRWLPPLSLLVAFGTSERVLCEDTVRLVEFSPGTHKALGLIP